MGKAGQKDLLKQVALDNFGHNPFLYFPLFYSVREVVQANFEEEGEVEEEADLPGLRDLVHRAMGKYRENMVVDNLRASALWIPGGLIVYSVPLWLRMPSSHGISLAWTMAMSFFRGRDS